MTFRKFAQLFAELDSPLGDLAADIARDKEFDDTWDTKRMRQYLEFRCGHDDRCKMIVALVALYESGVC